MMNFPLLKKYESFRASLRLGLRSLDWLIPRYEMLETSQKFAECYRVRIVRVL